MKTNKKYIVFYCDNCELLSEVIQQMITMYPDLNIKTSSNVEDLLGNMRKQLPAVILVYMTVRDESFVSVVKKIRESVTGSNTPVVIYQELPDELDLKKLSERI
jgi:DNA-binding NarL/FixJ family response regulator